MVDGHDVSPGSVATCGGPMTITTTVARCGDWDRISSGPDGAYTYTARGTLSRVDDGVASQVYDFDSLGRLSQFDDGVDTVTYAYDGLDRVASRNGSPFTYNGFSLDPVSVSWWAAHLSV